MSGLLVVEGQQQMLRIALGQGPADDLVCRLYVNKRRPERRDRAAMYTELTGHGYAPILVRAQSMIIDVASEEVLAIGPVCEWRFQAGPPVQVHGYLLTGLRTGRLWGAELITPTLPRPVELEGDVIRIRPIIQLLEALEA